MKREGLSEKAMNTVAELNAGDYQKLLDKMARTRERHGSATRTSEGPPHGVLMGEGSKGTAKKGGVGDTMA